MFSNIPSYVSLARNKLQDAANPGARDDLRLCRWVLLKNTLSRALIPESLSATSPPNPDHDESCIEEDVFQFPDGDIFADSFDEKDSEVVVSEEQWLDSLLEALDHDSESDVPSIMLTADEDEDEEFDLASLTIQSTDDVTSTPPEFIALPPSPPLVPSHSHYSSVQHPLYETCHVFSCLPSGYHDDDLPLLDSIDDASDDDSESLDTPRSQRSLASIEDIGSYRTPYIQTAGSETSDTLDRSSLIHPIEPFFTEC